MKKIARGWFEYFFAVCTFCYGVCLSSCSDDVDTSDIYTFTGQNLYEYLEESSNYSSFAYIMSQVPLSDRSNSTFAQLLTTRGNYTCFAPTNEAVQEFVDSIYLTEGYDITQLPDSTAEYIVRNSFIDNGDEEAYYTTDFEGGALEKKNMEDRYITISFDTIEGGSLAIMVNTKSRIVEEDIEVENGVIHGVNHVIELSSAMLPELLSNTDNMRIFSYLLDITSWSDSMMLYKDDDYEDIAYNYVSEDGCIVPDTRYYGYTAFVEPDSIYVEKWGVPELVIQNGVVTNWDVVMSVIQEKCADLAPDATDTDFTSEDNAVNQFVSYHLYGEQMTWDNMVVHHCEYGYGYNTPSQLSIDCFEYYECMGTTRRLLKLTEGSQTDGRRINRHCSYDYDDFSELEVDRIGIEVSQNNGNYENQALNGFYYPLDDVLTYDSDVPDVVLNERIRWDISSLLPELITNGYRRISNSEEYEFPQGYFDNMEISDESNYRYFPYYSSTVCNYQGDEHNVNGQYDMIFRLPPVPYEGTFELRWGAPHFSTFGMAQLYIGTNPDNLVAVGLPLDLRPDADWEGIGAVRDTGDEDTDDENDKALRNHGYMKAPKHDCVKNGGSATYDTLRDPSSDFYFIHMRLRYIAYTGHISPTDVLYLRIKSVLEDTSTMFVMDYMEWCPKSVYNGIDAEDKW